MPYAPADIGRSIITGHDALADETAFWERRVAGKEALVSEKAVRIQDLKNFLSVFVGEYNSRVGVHFVKLDKIKLEIDIYLYRLDRMEDLGVTLKNLEAIENEVREKFGEHKKKLDEKERETSRSSDEYRSDLSRRERGELLSEEMQKKIKVIFRKLALKYHPDKARDEKQRGEYHLIMAAINEAYAAGDVGILVLYLERAGKEDKIKVETPQEKLARLKDEDRKLDEILEKLEKEREEIMDTDTWDLKNRVDTASLEGQDLLSELAANVLQGIRDYQEILDELIAEYKEMISEIDL